MCFGFSLSLEILILFFFLKNLILLRKSIPVPIFLYIFYTDLPPEVFLVRLNFYRKYYIMNLLIKYILKKNNIFIK